MIETVGQLKAALAHTPDDHKLVFTGSGDDVPVCTLSHVVTAMKEDGCLFVLVKLPPKELCAWPGCTNEALCTTGNLGGALVCRDHFEVTNGKAMLECEHG